MARKLEYTLKAKDGFSRTMRKAKDAFRGLGMAAKRVGGLISSAFRGAAVATVAGVGLISAAVKKAFDFEALRTQLKVLLGTAEAAKNQFETLTKFSATTPFELPGIVDAYQQLYNFTDGALAAEKGLRMVGDAAAARGKDFSEVAYWVGRLYSALENGDPFMDSVGALQRLGILGGTIRGDLEKLTKGGADFGAKWAVVTKQLGKFEGGMDELSKTGKGLFSTLRDNWSIALATFGDAFAPMVKDTFGLLIGYLQKLKADGTIEAWAEKSAEKVDELAAKLKPIFSPDEQTRNAAFKAIGTDLSNAFTKAAEAAGEILGQMAPGIGRGIAEGFQAAGREVAKDAFGVRGMSRGDVGKSYTAGILPGMYDKAAQAAGALPFKMGFGFEKALRGMESASGAAGAAMLTPPKVQDVRIVNDSLTEAR